MISQEYGQEAASSARESSAGLEPLAPEEIPLALFRPRSAGEIVDSAFAIFRDQPGRIIMAALPLILAVESISTYGQYRSLKGLRDAFRGGLIGLPVPVWVSAGESPLSVLAWLLEFLITVAVVVAAADAYVGREVSVLGSYRTLIRKIPQFAGLFVIWVGVVIGPAILATAMLFVSPGLGLLLLVAAVPWTIYAWVAFRLAPAAMIVEGSGPIDSFRRSARLVSGSWFRAFGVVLMAEFITWIVNTGIQALILLFTSSRPPSGLGFVGIAAAMVLLPAITVRPFSAIVDVTLYFDLRTRREALDIEAAAAVATGEPLRLAPRIHELKWGIPFSPVPTSGAGAPSSPALPPPAGGYQSGWPGGVQ